MNVKDPTIEPLKSGQTRDPHDRLYVQDLVTLQIYRAGNVPKRKTEHPMQPGHLRLVRDHRAERNRYNFRPPGRR